eukprot:TRINITY_DN8334_c0_g1_i1.p1 TRINITY_DN8334_c0_g1~~TRINITY_DN8334_c0_g1_i1.p1  ORF type:complete len:152 (-),score=27.58 TRINITY_DN8334_c0_g1_i1:319-774(-)
MEGTRKVILFDGVCNLCDGFVNFVFAKDKQKDLVFYYAAQQSVGGQELLRRYNQRTDLKTVYYIEEETGQVYEQSSAILRVLSYLGWPYKAAYGFMIIPSFIRNFAYKLIAANRYRMFGQHDTCSYTYGLKNRFIKGGLEDMPASEGPKEV